MNQDTRRVGRNESGKTRDRASVPSTHALAQQPYFPDKGMRCSNCGSTHLMQNGTCHVCMNCGTTTGCS